MIRRGAFTLIEVLVSVAIIALLVSIALPSISAAKRVSKKTQCQHNLHQIGVGLQAYLQVNRDIFPTLCRLPSIEPAVAEADGNRPPYIPIAKGLSRELGNRSKVLACPADVVTELEDGTLASIVESGSKLRVGNRYYDSEDTSYEWTTQVNGLHRHVKTVPLWHGIVNAPLRIVPILFDYETFHGGPRMKGSLNNLYADLRVVSK